jgi:hypothetical protein
MKIVGQVSTREEAKELESIVKHFVVAGRIKKLAVLSKGEDIPIEDTTMIIPTDIE